LPGRLRADLLLDHPIERVPDFDGSDIALQ
jgi:hypothetical protein